MADDAPPAGPAQLRPVSPIAASARVHVETGDFGRGPARPADLGPVPAGPAPMQIPESPDSAELRRMCSEFLDFKKNYVNKQKEMENDMKIFFPQMDKLLSGLEKLSKRINDLGSEVPRDETALRLQNDRLNYFIVTSATCFREVDNLLVPLRNKVGAFTKHTTESNAQIDRRLEKIILSICGKQLLSSSHGFGTETAQSSPASTSRVSISTEEDPRNPSSTNIHVTSDIQAAKRLFEQGRFYDRRPSEPIDTSSIDRTTSSDSVQLPGSVPLHQIIVAADVHQPEGPMEDSNVSGAEAAAGAGAERPET